ncbi:MAG: lysylphosphatidylglycerol synthase transmembrane domain-containing protein [Balneolaceae bacterium]
MKEPETSKQSSSGLISTRYLLISLALSTVGMAVVIWMTWSPGVLEHLVPKRMPGLVIAIGVIFLRIWFVAAKIHFLAEKEITWMGAVRVALTWDFASAVTPSTIGGAPVATYALTREGIRLGNSTAIVLYGVLLDQFWYAMAVPVLLIAGIWFEVIPSGTGMVGLVTMGIIYFGLLAYGALLAYGLLVQPSALKKVVKTLLRFPFLRRFREKVMVEAESLEQYSMELRAKPAGFIGKAFYFSTMAWLCRVAIPPIVVLSLLPAEEVLLILRSLAMNLAFLVIPTPGGSGGVEGLFVVFMGPLIERTAFIGLAVFLWRVMTYYVSIGLGVMATTWYVDHQVVKLVNNGDDSRDIGEDAEESNTPIPESENVLKRSGNRE